MKITTWAHCIYQIRYHQVMVTKYRREVLISENSIAVLKESIQEIWEKYGYIIDEIWTDWDHIHLFVWAWWEPWPSRVMWVIKSLTAKRMLQLPEVKKELRWWSFRSAWWYIGTVWEWTNEEIVRRYIRNQWLDEQYYGRLNFHSI